MATKQKPVKKIPERRCIGCGEHFPKPQLIRVVRSPEGNISLDFQGRAAGRGAYLCRSVTCLQKARKAHRLEAAFSCRIENEIYEALEAQLSHDDG